MCDPVSISIAASTVIGATTSAINGENQRITAEKAQKSQAATAAEASNAALAAQKAAAKPMDANTGQTAVQNREALSRLRMGMASTIATSPTGLMAPEKTAAATAGGTANAPAAPALFQNAPNSLTAGVSQGLKARLGA